MSLRAQFKTDSNLETEGIELDYGDAVFTVARAGGPNRKYTKALAKALKPYNPAIDSGSVKESQLLPAILRPFLDHVLLNWQTRGKDGKLQVGIEPSDGSDKLIPFTKDAALAFFLEVPELYYQLNNDASGRKLFLENMEAAAGNS